MREPYKAVGVTIQDKDSRWKATMITKRGSLETWGHETRSNAERAITHMAGRLGWTRVGEWIRNGTN